VRGVIYFGKGQYDRAIDDYNKAALLNPNNMAIYYNRGKAYEKKGQYDKALEDFKRVNIIK
jgi:tetratricopeptide (TPR) repeat protein